MNFNKLAQETSVFFEKETNKILDRIATAKTKKEFELAYKQLKAIKKRIAFEIKMIDRFLGEND